MDLPYDENEENEECEGVMDLRYDSTPPQTQDSNESCQTNHMMDLPYDENEEKARKRILPEYQYWQAIDGEYQVLLLKVR